MISLALSPGDAALRAEIPSVLTFGLAAIAVLINWIVVKTIIERVRFHRAGKLGFDAFLAAGAPLTHDELVGAFADPHSFRRGDEKVRIVPLGTVRLPSGRLAFATPNDVSFAVKIEALDVALPSDRELEVEGLSLGDDPSWGFAALRIVVGEGEAVSLEPAFTRAWREELSPKQRRLPTFRAESGDDVIVGPVELLETFHARLGKDGSVQDDLKLTAPQKFASRKDLPPLSNVVTAAPVDMDTDDGDTDDGGSEPLSLVIARTWLEHDAARPLLQRDRSGDVVAVLVDFGALGEARWNWTPGR